MLCAAERLHLAGATLPDGGGILLAHSVVEEGLQCSAHQCLVFGSYLPLGQVVLCAGRFSYVLPLGVQAQIAVDGLWCLLLDGVSPVDGVQHVLADAASGRLRMLLHKLCDAVARQPIEHCLPVVILLQERFHAPAHVVAVAALGKISEELLEVLGIGEREQAGIPLLLALLLLQYLQIIIAAGACCTEQQKQENDARDACTKVGTANNDADGNITFNLGEQFAAKATTDTITYYLVENASNDLDITYDPAVYEITVTVEDRQTVLMSVPTQKDSNSTKNLIVHNYTIKGVTATKHSGDSTSRPDPVQAGTEDYYLISDPNGGKTFTNTCTQYTSTGSWTPKATKVVEGGEMKEFTLQLAADKDFTKNVQNKSTQPAADKSQTLSFGEINYTLDDLAKGEDATGRGASKTFTYYVREQPPTTSFTNYTYDKSVYKITVNATDQSDKTIKCDVTYTKIVDADGKDIPEKEQKAVTYVPAKDEATGKEQSVPVFTNTYSTSLPLSGMSGVTLTYLAGAAVLCAAAAWMHIRRKANAKGGERRE